MTPVCWACIETLRSMSAWDIEYWLPARDHDGYEVSNLGGVRSVDRLSAVKRDGRTGTPYRHRLKGQVLKLAIDGSGYTTTGSGPLGRVPPLVLKSFVGPRPSGQHSLH